MARVTQFVTQGGLLMPKIKVTAKGIEALVKQPHPRRVDYSWRAASGQCGLRGGWYADEGG